MINKLKILIVEDNPEEASHLNSLLCELQYDVIETAYTLDTALDMYLTHQPDLCIIDIYLNGKPDGVVFAQQISDSNNKIPFLFLTSNYDNITFQLAKTTNPHNYLLKPYNPLELQYAIELAIEKVRDTNIYETDTLFIKKGNGMSRISVSDIIYIEVDGKYSKVISETEKFLIQQPLKELQAQLPASMFSRIHRNYIVNIKEVTKIDTITNELVLRNGITLFFSRRYMDNFFTHFKVLK